MCLIIHKPKAKTSLNPTYIDNAETKNPDGFGIVYLDDLECITTMDYERARTLLEVKRPFVAHYRYATKGPVILDNCHPFFVDKPERWLFSNGTVADLGSKDKCDTQVVCDILSNTPEEHWDAMLSFTETRFALVDGDGNVTRHGKWHKKEGVYYSKSDCFAKYIGYGTGYTSGHYNWSGKYSQPLTSYSKKSTSCTTRYSGHLAKEPICSDPLYEDDYYDNWYSDTDYPSWENNNKVAVYGTLKGGGRNYDRFNTGMKLVSTGYTINKYPLQISSSLPYMFDEAGKGHNVRIEVYEVDKIEDRDSLDTLEGVPWHYQRKQIPVELDNGDITNAWLYFKANALSNPNTKMIQSY
jgi:gamma-glutamylcyclotransferase (GGCT)/AIG2-like uncharacterized protein YtfP